MSGIVSLELQIISINVIGLFGSIWNWFKWDQQLEKISKFSVSDELDVKDIDWLKTVLSWIEVVRSVIDRTLFPAYIANIYTIATRRWQNSLIFWMVLSLLKDIVLEVVVIIITFLQWHKGSVSTLLFIEFITEKTIWLAISTGKWWTILKWYTQLRRESKIRRFARITRRSIASIPGRIGHSLDDERLDIAAVRRNKYASLLNLDKLAEKSSNKINFVNLRISKSLTSVINNDSHDSNDTNDSSVNDSSVNDSSVNDSSVNDLSVTEKSMKLLGITAEDVMDACARIQERFYWNEEDVTEKTPEAKEKVVAQFSLEKDGEEMDDALGNKQKNNIGKTADRTLKEEDIVKDSQIEKDGRKNKEKINDALRSKQTTKDVEKAVDCNLMKEIIMQNIQIEREGEEDNNKIISVDKKEQILIDEKQDVTLTKGRDVTPDRVNNRAKSTESHELQEDASSRKKKRGERAERLARIEHCPLSSTECKHARNMEAKPCASFVRKLEARLRPISTNQKERWLDQLDRRKHPYRGKLTPTGSDANKKECHKNSRTSLCACHRASKRNTDALRNGKYARSIDINDKNIKHDIDKKEFRHFLSIVNKQKDKINGRDSTFKYSEAYRLRKQMQKFEGFPTKQTIAWGSISLAQTARPSGYTRDVVATDKPPGICQRDVQTEACDESSDSLNARNRSEQRVRSRQSIDPRFIYNSSLTEKNYARSEKRETKTSEAQNDLMLLASKRGMKARRRHDLSPSRKLSNEEREAVELRALRAFNELTLLEDKKKLEEKKNRESSLNFEQSTGESEVTEMKVYKSYNDLTLLEERKEMDATRGHNSSCKQSIEESSALKVCNEYISEDKEELKAEGKHESKYEMPERYEENIETSTSVSNYLPEVNREEIGNSSSELNERHAEQACMSLNLREITRNIEWSFHPRGVILTNKNLHRQFLENERSRESQQRDIVDDNIASTLHSAFFFKPEIVTRIFRRAQTRIGESLPSFPTFCREDLNTEFVCRVNNETVVRWDRDSSSFDFDLERITDRGNLGSSSFPDASGNHVTGEDNRDLCIIFIDQEQGSHESETAIIEDSITIGSQEDTRSSVENIETTNILLVCILRDFGIEVSEENVHDVTSSAERIEEYGDISNVIANNTDFPSSNFTAINTSLEEENRREDTILSHQQILHDNSNDNRQDDVDVTSSVNLLHDNPCNLPDKKYISAIDVSSEKIIYENNSSLRDADNTTSQLSNSSNNNQFDTLVNKSEKSISNRIPENASQLSSSFIKENNFNQSMLRSSDEEELQKLTQLSDSEVTLENHRRESVMNLETTNNDTISRSENVETSNLLETMVRGVRNEDEDGDIYEKANIFSINRFFRANQEDESLQQDDSFYSMFERNDDDGTKTPVSLGDGSVMEEFSNNTISETSSNTSTRNSAHS